MTILFEGMKLAEGVRGLIVDSIDCAKLRGEDEIRTEHLLLAILSRGSQVMLSEEASAPTVIIGRLVYGMPGLIHELEEQWKCADEEAGRHHRTVPSWPEKVDAHPTLGEAMRFAHREAMETIAPNEIIIDETYVLLGIAMEQNGLGGEVLRRFGDIVTLRKMVIALRAETQAMAA